MSTSNTNPPRKRQKLTPTCDFDFVIQLSKLQNRLIQSPTEINEEGSYLSFIHNEDKPKSGKPYYYTKSPLLLQYGTDVNMGSRYGRMDLLHPAPGLAQDDDYNVPKEVNCSYLHLLTEGIDVNMTAESSLNNLLHDVIFNEEIVLTQHEKCIQSALRYFSRLLTSDGAEVNCSREQGDPLHEAEVKSRLLIVQFLLKFGSDTNKSSLTSSSLPHHQYQTDEIINYKPNSDLSNEVIKMLLLSGSGVNCLADKHRRSPLNCHFGRYLTDLLFINGDNVNCVKNTYFKSLHEVFF